MFGERRQIDGRGGRDLQAGEVALGDRCLIRLLMPNKLLVRREVVSEV